MVRCLGLSVETPGMFYTNLQWICQKNTASTRRNRQLFVVLCDRCLQVVNMHSFDLSNTVCRHNRPRRSICSPFCTSEDGKTSQLREEGGGDSCDTIY